MPSELEVVVFVRLDGRDVPGFEGGLRYREQVTRAEQVVTEVAAESGPIDSPAQEVSVSQVFAISAEKPLIVYTGNNHIDGLNLGAGGFVVVAGLNGMQGGFDVENEGSEPAPLKGVVAGTGG